MFANVKEKLKPKKGKAVKTDKKADIQFVCDHIEEFKFFVKYYPVFQNLAVCVGEKEIVKLNDEKPCVFRKKSDIPFRCTCEICANNGEPVKTIKECKNCKASKQE